MSSVEIPEGWAVLTLTNGLVIAGYVRMWATSGSVHVCVGRPCRAVMLLPQSLVGEGRACAETDAHAFQAGNCDAFLPGTSEAPAVGRL